MTKLHSNQSETNQIKSNLKNEHGERLYKYQINGIECYMTVQAGTSLSYNHTLMVHCLE